MCPALLKSVGCNKHLILKYKRGFMSRTRVNLGVLVDFQPSLCNIQMIKTFLKLVKAEWHLHILLYLAPIVVLGVLIPLEPPLKITLACIFLRMYFKLWRHFPRKRGSGDCFIFGDEKDISSVLLACQFICLYCFYPAVFFWTLGGAD